MAARERVVFLLRCALVAAAIASLWGFHATYLSSAARAGDQRPNVVLLGVRAPLVYVPYTKDGGQATAVVHRFLDASRRGDARAACRELSPSARRLVAWRVTERPQPRSEAGCERHILRGGDRSGTPSPRLIRLLERGFVIERFDHTLVARPTAVRGWALVLIGERGRVWIEEGGAEHAKWRAVTCAKYGYRRSACECIYEQAQLDLLRRLGPRYGLILNRRDAKHAARACT